MVGAADGALVGEIVGEAVGGVVGATDGAFVGDAVGGSELQRKQLFADPAFTIVVEQALSSHLPSDDSICTQLSSP